MSTITRSIQVPLPELPGRLRIQAGACRLRIAGGALCTPAALAGGGPVLTVEASVALGALALKLG
jgi:hypothetical protein